VPVEARLDARPELESPAPVTPARELPEIAEKADNRGIKKAVDDAAAVGGRQTVHNQIELDEQLHKGESKRRLATRSALRRQLPGNIFVQFLTGPSELPEGAFAFGRLVTKIALVTLIVVSILLLFCLTLYLSRSYQCDSVYAICIYSYVTIGPAIYAFPWRHVTSRMFFRRSWYSALGELVAIYEGEEFTVIDDQEP
jgi:hypothetical protein